MKNVVAGRGSVISGKFGQGKGLKGTIAKSGEGENMGYGEKKKKG